jgi:hypothetical protein
VLVQPEHSPKDSLGARLQDAVRSSQRTHGQHISGVITR